MLVTAVINSGPREDATRIGSAGVLRACSHVCCTVYIHDVLTPPRSHLHHTHIIKNNPPPGVVRRQAVDISPLRRVDQAIYLLTTGAREAAFRNIKTIAECLADELINASKGSSNSYAIKKKDEIERVAKANR